jgi:hypothetical protein
METANFRFFALNGNGKRKFVFLGRQMINSNRQLLFKQTCLSMVAGLLNKFFFTTLHAGHDYSRSANFFSHSMAQMFLHLSGSGQAPY